MRLSIIMFLSSLNDVIVFEYMYTSDCTSPGEICIMSFLAVAAPDVCPISRCGMAWEDIPVIEA